MLKRIFFNIVFLCTPLMSDALQFEHLTVEDGLSNNMVFCIHQDSIGFMWFGTGDGLDRYDGIEFRAFKHDPFDSTSLSNNSIKCIHEDQHHRLWIGTEYGLMNSIRRSSNSHPIFLRLTIPSEILSIVSSRMAIV